MADNKKHHGREDLSKAEAGDADPCAEKVRGIGSRRGHRLETSMELKGCVENRKEPGKVRGRKIL